MSFELPDSLEDIVIDYNNDFEEHIILNKPEKILDKSIGGVNAKTLDIYNIYLSGKKLVYKQNANNYYFFKDNEYSANHTEVLFGLHTIKKDCKHLFIASNYIDAMLLKQIYNID